MVYILEMLVTFAGYFSWDVNYLSTYDIKDIFWKFYLTLAKIY